MHSGSNLGLCPREGISLDEGRYEPSPPQQIVYGYWRTFHREFVPSIVGEEPYDLVNNGDTIENRHHGCRGLITLNRTDQRRIAKRLLWPEIKRCRARGGEYFHLEGTEAHGGEANEDENEIAEDLEAKPLKVGGKSKYARPQLLRRLGPYVVHYEHHFGSADNALIQEYRRTCAMFAGWEYPMPDAIVRAHIHQHRLEVVPNSRGGCPVVVLPCWQLPTPFSRKLPKARCSAPNFGGVVLEATDAGIKVHSYCETVKGPAIE